MGGENLQERLYVLVSNQLGVEREELVPQARILDDLGADSLDVVELVMALEESFDIVVPDEDVETLQTLLDVQQYLELRTATA
ncbi:MAG: acyl carrier protein [Myxococcota bacterium]